MMAISSGSLQVLDVVLQANADVNATTEEVRSLLNVLIRLYNYNCDNEELGWMSIFFIIFIRYLYVGRTSTLELLCNGLESHLSNSFFFIFHGKQDVQACCIFLLRFTYNRSFASKLRKIILQVLYDVTGVRSKSEFYTCSWYY